MRILVTGNAGFIGFHLAMALLERGDAVVGVDVVNDYYDVTLKERRLGLLSDAATRLKADYQFHRINLADRAAVEAVFQTGAFDRVIHLAAQPGVRYSLVNPLAYVESNIVGFTTILEACRHAKVPHLTYASTSSVYGASTVTPSAEDKGADHPIQFYAATKRANELMAHSYSHLFQLPTTGLRFFTVYGPWGRPDMAPFLFVDRILRGQPIDVFNNGNHSRDFTYVSDIVEGVIRASDDIAAANPDWNGANPDPASSTAPFRILNIGNSSPVRLNDYIEALEKAVGRRAERKLLPLQPGDVPDTFADVSRLISAVGYRPQTSTEEGVRRFVEWYRDFYGR